jgi:hypothetical protein
MDYSIKRIKYEYRNERIINGILKVIERSSMPRQSCVSNGLAAIVLHVSIRAIQSGDNVVCFSPQFCEY